MLAANPPRLAGGFSLLTGGAQRENSSTEAAGRAPLQFHFGERDRSNHAPRTVALHRAKLPQGRDPHVFRPITRSIRGRPIRNALRPPASAKLRASNAHWRFFDRHLGRAPERAIHARSRALPCRHPRDRRACPFVAAAADGRTRVFSMADPGAAHRRRARRLIDLDGNDRGVLARRGVGGRPRPLEEWLPSGQAQYRPRLGKRRPRNCTCTFIARLRPTDAAWPQPVWGPRRARCVWPPTQANARAWACFGRALRGQAAMIPAGRRERFHDSSRSANRSCCCASATHIDADINAPRARRPPIPCACVEKCPV